MEQKSGEDYEFVVTYEPSQALKAAGLYWRKSHVFDFFLAIVFLGVYGLLQALPHFNQNLAAAVLVIAVLLLVFQGTVFLVQWQRSRYVIKQMEVHETRWRFSDERFEYENQWGQSIMKWPLIKRILIGEDIWLLMTESRIYITLPIADVPAAALDFLKEKVIANGGKLR